MHTLLGLSGLLLVVVGGLLALVALRWLDRWAHRRDLQFLVLAAPLVALGLGAAGVHHFAGRICFLGAPPWDYTLAILLPLAMGLVALGAFGLGLVRLLLVQRLVARRGLPAHPALQALVERLAARLGARAPRALLCAYDQPLAITCGLRRSTVLLSHWMIRQLDSRELEAVLAHELAHAARRDYLVTWLATVLRDAFFYLPTSWVAHRQLRREKELASDDLAVQATGRPLALASALARVWQQSVGGPAWRAAGVAQALLGADDLMEGRIERLLAGVRTRQQLAQERSTMLSRAGGIGAGVSSLGGLLALEAANAAVLLAPMSCGPLSVLAKLL